MNVKTRFKSAVKQKLWSLASTANVLLGNYRDVIWLIGDGRSGTTWVSTLINHDCRYREMFEPFHPQLVPDADFLVPHQYVPNDALDEELLHFARRVFSGRLTDDRVDSFSRPQFFNGLLVKDIFANLMAYAVTRKLGFIKPVLLLRNPFAVALSKQKRSHWFWLEDPADLLQQGNLYQDFLQPFEGLIRETSNRNDFILNQVLIWAIINYIPLKQFDPEELHVCFYENIYTDPLLEVRSLLNFVKGCSDSEEIDLNRELIDRPSYVTGKDSSVMADNLSMDWWRERLAPELIDHGMEILGHFGMSELYDDRSMPDLNVLSKLQTG